MMKYADRFAAALCVGALICTATPSLAQSGDHLETIHHPDYDKSVFMPFVPALKVKSGKLLWQVRTSNAVNSFPITYSVNGKQYVAVAVGNGSSHARSLATLTPEIRSLLGIRLR